MLEVPAEKPQRISRKPSALPQTMKLSLFRPKREKKERENVYCAKIMGAGPAQPPPRAESPAGVQERGQSPTPLPELFRAQCQPGASSGSPSKAER